MINSTSITGSFQTRTNATKQTKHTITKKISQQLSKLTDFYLSGYQDSNLGPPAPKAGALTGLRYIPIAL